MSEKTVVVALGHKALGTTLPEQKTATRAAAKAIADLVEDGANVVISHSNGPPGRHDTHCNERIRKSTSGLHLRAYVRLLCHESGLHRI